MTYEHVKHDCRDLLRMFGIWLAVFFGCGCLMGHCSAQVTFHPSVVLEPGQIGPYQRGVWAIFDPEIADPFLWTSSATSTAVTIREVAALNPGTGCPLRLNVWRVSGLNPATYSRTPWVSFPPSPFNPEIEAGLSLGLWPWSGYGVDYGTSMGAYPCAGRWRPLLVAVLLEVR